MCLYDRAIEELKTSSTVEVFAPSGIWCDDESKDEWITALCEAKHVARVLIVGDGFDKKTRRIAKHRLDRLVKSGAEVYKLDAMPDFKTGIILFDNKGLFGVQVCEDIRLWETSIPSHLKEMCRLIEDGTKAGKRYD